MKLHRPLTKGKLPCLPPHPQPYHQKTSWKPLLYKIPELWLNLMTCLETTTKAKVRFSSSQSKWSLKSQKLNHIIESKAFSLTHLGTKGLAEISTSYLFSLWESILTEKIMPRSLQKTKGQVMSAI